MGRLPVTRDLEPIVLIALKITRPLKGASLRALYLTERVTYQLVDKDDPQILRDPPEFVLAPHSMTDAEYISRGSGVSYAKRLLEGLDYKDSTSLASCFLLLFKYMLKLLFFFFFFFFFFSLSLSLSLSLSSLSWLLMWKIVIGGTYCQ